jgi:hypothetical protein
MYEIFLYSGGVYRFDEFKEAVEDIGGVVLKKDNFHISRGASFLAEEVHVMIIIPLPDENIVRSLSDELKGHLSKLELDETQLRDILTYVSVCDALIQSGSAMTLDEISTFLECPCPAEICYGQELEVCIHDDLEETLDKFCQKKIIKSREVNGETEYYLPDPE